MSVSTSCRWIHSTGRLWGSALSYDTSYMQLLVTRPFLLLQPARH